MKQMHTLLCCLQSLTVMQAFRSTLMRAERLHNPVVHFDASCGSQAYELQRMVTDLQGEVAQSASKHGVLGL